MRRALTRPQPGEGRTLVIVREAGLDELMDPHGSLSPQTELNGRQMHIGLLSSPTLSSCTWNRRMSSQCCRLSPASHLVLTSSAEQPELPVEIAAPSAPLNSAPVKEE